MKFIVDAQLPISLSNLLKSRGHDSIHTLELPEKNKTKDNDFLESFLISGRPPKLILVRTGNVRNSELLAIFDNHIERIADIMEGNSLIEITKTEIVIHV